MISKLEYKWEYLIASWTIPALQPFLFTGKIRWKSSNTDYFTANCKFAMLQQSLIILSTISNAFWNYRRFIPNDNITFSQFFLIRL